LQAPSDGTSTGQLEYAGSQWSWKQVVDELQVPGIKRITVQVRRLAEPGAASTADDSADADWLATTIGFRGDAINGANGEQPDWNGIAFNAGIGGAPTGGSATGSSATGTSPTTGGSAGDSTGPGGNNGVPVKP
jgi:Type II secretion system (T2SS), protein I